MRLIFGREVRECGAVGFVSKRFDMKRILQAIRNSLDRTFSL